MSYEKWIIFMVKNILGHPSELRQLRFHLNLLLATISGVLTSFHFSQPLEINDFIKRELSLRLSSKEMENWPNNSTYNWIWDLWHCQVSSRDHKFIGSLPKRTSFLEADDSGLHKAYPYGRWAETKAVWMLSSILSSNLEENEKSWDNGQEFIWMLFESPGNLPKSLECVRNCWKFV